MSSLSDLNFSFRKTLPVVLQTESTECAMACLAMVAAFHGCHLGLGALRGRFPSSLKGSDFEFLDQCAGLLGLSSRAVALEVDELVLMRRPCILHWNMNHFVVLQSVSKKGVVIHDPATGRRLASWKEVGEAFTGVAMELWPNKTFRKEAPPPQVPLLHFAGDITGFGQTLWVIFLMAAGLEAVQMITPLFSQWLVDHVFVSAEQNQLVTLMLAMAAATVITEILAVSRSWMVTYISTNLSLQWRSNVVQALLGLPVSYFEKRSLGDIVSRLGSVDAIQNVLTHQFVSVVLDGIMGIAILVIMLNYSTLLTLYVIAGLALYALGRVIWYLPLKNATAESILIGAKVNSNLLETVRGAKAIKLFGREEIRRASYLSMLVDATNAGLRIQRLGLTYQAWLAVVGALSSGAIMYLGAHMVFDGTFTIGMYMAFGVYKGQFSGRVSALIDAVFSLRMLEIQKERLADIVLHKPESGGAPAPELLPRAEPLGFEMQGVRFAYAAQEPEVLKGVSFKILPGECVALVGGSGCGKSTLLGLLLGVQEVTGGKILLGGKDLTSLGLPDVRRAIGTVLQDDTLFAGSISENISFFDLKADQNWIEACARVAAVDQAILAMPMGYRSLVGDMGSALSGGQKQRILLARALYKRPQILLLDEATSHLDIFTEAQVNEAIKALKITRLMAAHRPQTIQSADRVIEIVDGLAVEKTVHS